MFPRSRRFSIVAVAIPAAAAVTAAAVSIEALQACGSETKGPVLFQARSDDAGLDATTAGRADDAASPPDGANPGDGQGTDGADACASDGGRGNAVILGSLTVSQQYGGHTTGTGYDDPCPTNQAVVGYRGFLTSADSGLIGDLGRPAIVVGGIQTVCAALAVAALPSNQIVTSPSTVLPMRGTAQDSPWTQLCPPNEVVIRFSGRSGLALDQVAFECGHWGVPNACDSPSIDRTPTMLSPVGGDGGGPFQDGCPAGQMATGSVIRAGRWVDAFGLLCKPPLLGSDGG